jgi:hypothetical protein
VSVSKINSQWRVSLDRGSPTLIPVTQADTKEKAVEMALLAAGLCKVCGLNRPTDKKFSDKCNRCILQTAKKPWLHQGLGFSYNDQRLAVFVTPEKQQWLNQEQESNEDFGSDKYLYELLEPLVCNSELQWINPSDTGDLTSAPMLGILAGDDELVTKQEGPCGATYVGRWDGEDRYDPIVNRWAFMDYQVRSVQEELASKGLAIFTSGN